MDVMKIDARRVQDGILLLIPSPQGGCYLRYVNENNPEFNKYLGEKNGSDHQSSEVGSENFNRFWRLSPILELH